MPRYAANPRDPKTELCASNLRSILRYRRMSVPDLAKAIGVSPRTIEAYTAGRVSIFDAKAKTVLSIADELKIDPHILIGEMEIEVFFNREQRKADRRRAQYAEMLAQGEADTEPENE